MKQTQENLEKLATNATMMRINGYAYKITCCFHGDFEACGTGSEEPWWRCGNLVEVSWGVLKALKVKLEWQEVIWWSCYCGSWCSITILDSSKQIWCMDTRIPRPISLPRNLLFTRSVLIFFGLKLGVRPQRLIPTASLVFHQGYCGSTRRTEA